MDISGVYDLEGLTLQVSNDIVNIAPNAKIINGTVILKEGATIMSQSDLISEIKVEIRGRYNIIDGLKWKNSGIAFYSNYNCSETKITNCQIQSDSNNSVKIIADKISSIESNITFSNCKFIFSRMGIELQNHGNSDYKIQDVIIKNCEFTALESDDYRYGISLTGYGKNVSITNCNFDKCVKGIELVGFSDVIIKQCNFTNGGKNSIISSNSRTMKNLTISNNTLQGLYIYNTFDSIISNNVINCLSYAEIKNSKNITFKNNNVTANAHYCLLLNQASENLIQNNTFIQQSTSNWAVIRCYGSKSVKNKIQINSITKSKGKKWDQYNGASDNIYQEKVSITNILGIKISELVKSKEKVQGKITY